MTNHTGCYLSSGAVQCCWYRYRLRLLSLLLLIGAATTQAAADDFYVYYYYKFYGYDAVGLSDAFAAQLDKANGGEFTGTTADGTTLTWRTGDPLPAFDVNYKSGTSGSKGLALTDLFRNHGTITSLDLSNFNTDNIVAMKDMFYGCTNLTSVKLRSFNTSNVTDMELMFYNCKALASLDLSSFTLNANVNLKNMFWYTCDNNQGEAYQGIVSTDETADKLNGSTTNINTAKLKFGVKKVAIIESNFPDAAFRSFLSTNYDKNGDGFLTEDESSVTDMNVSGLGIKSLKGIAYFTSLTSLDCSNNALTSLDLSKNTSLTTFNGAGQIVPATLSYDANSQKVYFDITGAEAGKLSITGNAFTLSSLRATSNGAVTARTMFDTVDFNYDTGLGTNKLSGTFSLRTYALPFDSQYATLCLPWNATVPQDMKAYTVTLSGNSALLTPYEGSVLPKETASVVEGTGTLLLRYSDTQAAAPAKNDLKGLTSDKAVAANSVMTLGNSNTTGILGFYTYTGTTIDAYKGYLDKVSGAKSYIISFGTTTAISLPASEETADTPWYSLHGVRLPVKPTQPGVYIHGKRKVVIK